MRSVWEKNRVTYKISWLVLSLTMLFAGTATAGEWEIERLDQAGVGKFSSMKIDNEGNAHVVYVVDDGERTPVKYGFWDHKLKRWFVMTIAQYGSFCSLTLDSKQRPHIAYVDAGSMPGAKLHYGHWDGTSWKIEAIPLNAEIIAYDASIALDSADKPSISFYEYTGPRGSEFRVRMRVVRWNSKKQWAVETVDGENQSGKFNSLAIDAQNHLHLAYANVNGMTAGIRYAYWDGAAWKLEILEGLPSSQTYLGYSVCLTLDKNGDPHVSYSQYSSPFLVKYAVRKGGHWKIQVVDQLYGVGYPDRNSIFVDDAGQPYISYFDAGEGSLKLAQRRGEKWIVETVDTNGVGYTSSVQVDHGSIWISYADEANGGFKIARRTLEPSTEISRTASLQTSLANK